MSANLRVRLLKSIIALSGKTDAQVAAGMGISLSSYYKRMRGEAEFKRRDIEAFDESLCDPETMALLDSLRSINSLRDVFFLDAGLPKSNEQGAQ